MTSPSRLLASVAFACALGCAGAVFSSTTPAAAAAEEGASASAERTIPVAPVDPASTAGRIVLAFADWLEQRGGSGSEALRLALDAPMRAEEQGGTVTVHLPGARLVRGAKSRPDWTLGDLAIAVTPRSATAYDFETAMPPQIDLPGGRLRSSEGTISGTWRSDVEVATRLDVDAATLGFHQRKGSAATGTADSFSLSDALVEDADGLWDGRTTVSLSGLKGDDFTLGGFHVASSFEDFDRDLVLAMRRDFGSFADDESAMEMFPDSLAPFIDARWGRSEATVTVQDLAVTGDEAFTLGSLVWHIDFDGRGALTDLAARIAVADLRYDGAAGGDIPPALIPHEVSVDVALNRVPLRRIAEAFSGLAERGRMDKPDSGMAGEVLLAHMDAADTAFVIRDIHVAAPAFELRADGRFNVEPASAFGVVGRVDARIRGLSTLTALAAEEGDEGAVSIMIVLQGLGRPVVEEGTDEPVHVYEIDLRRDGTVTVNGIPLDMLGDGGLAPS